MKKYIVAALVSCSLGILQPAVAQDVHFSQFYETTSMRNPALTGIFSGDYKAGVNYRSQWSSLSVPFVTMMAAAETKIAVNKYADEGSNSDYISVGLSGVYDKAGTINFNSTTYYLTLNYNKSLEDYHHTFLSVGFAGGYIQRSVDQTKMQFANQYQQGVFSGTNYSGENMNNTKLQHFDLGAGISLNSSANHGRINYYLGAAAYHLSKPKEAYDASESFVRLGMRWTGSVGLRAALTQQIGLTIHANYQNQAPYQETIGGLLLSWSGKSSTDGNTITIYGGCFYRLNDAIIPTLKVQYKNWGLTASYDISMTNKRMYMSQLGGSEFSLFVRGNYKQRSAAQLCPRFEELPEQEY